MEYLNHMNESNKIELFPFFFNIVYSDLQWFLRFRSERRGKVLEMNLFNERLIITSLKGIMLPIRS